MTATPTMRHDRRSGIGPARAAAAFLALAATLAAWVWASSTWFPADGEDPVRSAFPGSALLRGWVHFDAGWYFDIAINGYSMPPGRQASVAFFPTYPIAVRHLTPYVGSVELAGILITFVCGLCATVLVAAWTRPRLSPRAQTAALAVLLLQPYAWYLVGAVYADALFLAACVGAFVLVDRNRPLAAGVVGAVASATRPVGLALVVGLAVAQIERRDALRLWSGTPLRRLADRPGRIGRIAGTVVTVPVGIHLRRIRPVDAGVLVAACGFVGWCLWLWWRFGDPLAFSTVQRYWAQQSGPVTLLKLHLGGLILLEPTEHVRYILGCLLQGALVCGALLAVPRIIRRFGWGPGIYTVIALGLPVIGSKDFQGTGRYLLAAFPAVALAGEWLAERSPRTRRVVLVASGLLLLTWSHLYARGHYVA